MGPGDRLCCVFVAPFPSPDSSMCRVSTSADLSLKSARCRESVDHHVRICPKYLGRVVHTSHMVVSAVATTGIYCRPECGARPLPRNVSPFQSAVAAQASGYRPCLRCRPDRRPFDEQPGDAPEPVKRALALISGGYLDRFSEDMLASQVGYSVRQLRRLFAAHVGATPSFVARSRRAHFARRLLDETNLAMPIVAGASGFGSARQMNRVVESIFGFSPLTLRGKRRIDDVLTVDGGLRLRLPLSDPFDRSAAVNHLRPRVTPGVEAINGEIYRRTLMVCGNPGVVEVDLGAAGTHLEMRAHLPSFDSIIDDVGRIRSMFGLDDHAADAESQLGADPLIGSLVRHRPGLRVIGGWDKFETTVRVIVGQQVSVAGATTVTGRIVERVGMNFAGSALGLTRLFPTADRLVGLDPEGAGMPKARAVTVSAVAAAVIDGSLDLSGAGGFDATRQQLLAIPGIGPWTADVVMMRALRDPDVFPAGDLGIRRAIARLMRMDDLSSEAVVREMSQAWRPHRSLAAQHLWALLHDHDSEPHE